MLNLLKAYFEFDLNVVGGLLYKLIGMLDKHPIIKEYVSIVCIIGTNINLKALELIDRKLGE